MSDTKVPFPNPTLHAGHRLVVSGYARAQVADYGDRRAAERDSFWQSEAGNAAPTQGAEGAAPQAVVGEASERAAFETWLGLSLALNMPTANELRAGWNAWKARAALTPSPTPTAPQQANELREALKGTVAAIESMHGRKPEHVEAALANAKHALLAAPAQHQPTTLRETK